MNIKFLRQAIKLTGGQSALARLVGVSPTHVWNWLHRNKKVPASHVILIEKAVGVSRHDLRSDIYPREGREEEFLNHP